jgi:hypothetical protein
MTNELGLLDVRVSYGMLQDTFPQSLATHMN